MSAPMSLDEAKRIFLAYQASGYVGKDEAHVKQITEASKVIAGDHKTLLAIAADAQIRGVGCLPAGKISLLAAFEQTRQWSPTQFAQMRDLLCEVVLVQATYGQYVKTLTHLGLAAEHPIFGEVESKGLLVSLLEHGITEDDVAQIFDDTIFLAMLSNLVMTLGVHFPFWAERAEMAGVKLGCKVCPVPPGDL